MRKLKARIGLFFIRSGVWLYETHRYLWDEQDRADMALLLKYQSRFTKELKR